MSPISRGDMLQCAGISESEVAACVAGQNQGNNPKQWNNKSNVGQIKGGGAVESFGNRIDSK
jgi:hypothetical protein